MKSVTEDFTRRFQDEIIQIQAEFSTSPDVRHYLGNRKDEIILSELTQGIMKELKSHIKVNTRSIREGSTNNSYEKDEVCHTRVFFMTEDTYKWLISEIKELLNKLRGIEVVIKKKI